MSEKEKKQKAKDVQDAVETMSQRCVLVATYKKKPNQLKWIGKSHLYNYPLSKEESENTAWDKVKELWLYSGTKDGRHIYTAEFIGIKSRKDFIDEHPDYPKGSGIGHGDFYAVFNVRHKYQPTLDESVVVVRAADFKRTPKVAKAVKEYQAGGELGCLLDYLPSELAGLTHEQLRVCEEAVQLNFLASICVHENVPTMLPIAYAEGAVRFLGDVASVKPRTFRMGEFFCGPGGLACGALNARIEISDFRIAHAWANDYDAQTCETYRENICHDAPETVICGDVRKLCLDDARLTPIEGFAFGFPCNDFSVVGEHKGIDGNYGPLYQYGVAVLCRFRPMWFVAENVGGLASANEGEAFKRILTSMKDAGYRIYPHLYKFEEYGVPQTRHRIIIVGIRNDLPYVFYPPSPAALQPRDNSARAALENPPISACAPNNTLTAQNAKVVERLRYIRPGENAFTAKLPPHLRLNVKGAKISQIYKRLDPSKPAYTVTGSGGGGTHIYHYSEPRALTNRERARLQTFPDDYLFTGSKESVRRQIGMAVPPRGAQIIFEAVLRTFAGIDYVHADCNITEDGKIKKEAIS